jgi:hypothetical protein
VSTAANGRPDVGKTLARLKDFQRRTVDRVFVRLYQDDPPARRFLVADEVGLGKTLVARGVVVKAIDHLWNKVNRIDIVYLCSNGDIARQNVSRLTPEGVGHVPESPRITLLPLSAHDMSKSKVNVIPLTPGTSLNVAGSLGIKLERALLVHLLEGPWQLDRTAACRLFRGNAGLQRFKQLVKHFPEWHPVDRDLAQRFVQYVDKVCAEQKAAGQKTIRERLATLLNAYASDARPTAELSQRQREIIGELRQLLGKSCIQSLEPDLIILDEFQRFKDLLSGESPEAEMARQLFDYEDRESKARVLLLSATPYKMYTTPDEANGESHYDDFVRTAQFLLNEREDVADELARLLKDYRNAVFRIAQGGLEELADIRARLEQILRSVMVRTERLAVTPDRSGMLAERPVAEMRLEPRDITSYAENQRFAGLVEHNDTMEFWKASPWLLNFMEDYALAKDIRQRIEDAPRDPDLRRAINDSKHSLINWADVEAFRRLDPAHARLRWLTRHTLDGGLWRLLWLPATLPYYELGEAFRDLAGDLPSKTLIFSAWRVVPRVIASVLSHEAERRLYVAAEGSAADLTGAPERIGDRLRVGKREGTITGLTILSLLYPCRWMANHCDPLEIARVLRRATGSTPTLAAVVDEAERRLRPLIEKLTAGVPQRAAPDEAWYWALPLLIDLSESSQATQAWLASDLADHWKEGGREQRPARLDEDEDDDDSLGNPAAQRSGSVRSSWDDFIARIRRLAHGELPTGAPPKDAARALALMAIGGPATAVLRSFARIAKVAGSEQAARTAAARVGAAFRSLFNQPDSTAAVRVASSDDDYWKQCLDYSASLGLQATLDEYLHLLMSELGLDGKAETDRLERLAERIASVVGLRRAAVGAHHIHVRHGAMKRDSKRFRSRFSMRFGEERRDESDQSLRADDVRAAFNSPFGPFVLATTSVGQEGLDFHFYCHSVVHWNLPSNPVDLEQREGRVHRFKGLAVRKNVLRHYADAAIQADGSDPWELAFEQAKRARAESDNDLVPYWVYPIDDGASIDRYVPALPLSRDIERHGALRASLALYRMVFGQPRQEELVSYLANVLGPEHIQAVGDSLRISLEPS